MFTHKCKTPVAKIASNTHHRNFYRPPVAIFSIFVCLTLAITAPLSLGALSRLPAVTLGLRTVNRAPQRADHAASIMLHTYICVCVNITTL